MRGRNDEDAPLIVVCGLEFEARIVAGKGVVTVSGPGPQRVAEGLERLLGGAPDPARCWAGILSFGCAGATDPSLLPGACVLASAVWSVAGSIAVDRAWSRALRVRMPQAGEGLLGGLDGPLTSCTDKSRLWRETGVCAVDMESHAAARVAQRHGLPFAACRVVLDPAWRSLPRCALAAMRTDGSTDLAALLSALTAAPHEIGPLVALALDAWRARHALRRVRRQLDAALAPPA